MARSGSYGREDFDRAGRELKASLGGAESRRYAPLDAIYRHAAGGVLYCGNVEAARSRPALAEANVTFVVNCTREHALFFEGRGIEYLRFPIADWWKGSRGRRRGAESLLAFFEPLFDFVIGALRAGANVMVHCLAGAHRAGTASCALLMRLTGCDMTTAVWAAQQRRSIISPIGSFTDLLRNLDEALTSSGLRARAIEELAAAGPPADGDRRSPGDGAHVTL